MDSGGETISHLFLSCKFSINYVMQFISGWVFAMVQHYDLQQHYVQPGFLFGGRKMVHDEQYPYHPLNTLRAKKNIDLIGFIM